MKREILGIGVLVLLIVSAIPVVATAGTPNVVVAPTPDWTKCPNFAGAVYTEDNAAQNNVWLYPMFDNGTLGSGVSFSTGGAGTGTAFHSQGAIALTWDKQWLLAVDAGSNEITVFRVTHDGLVRTDKVSSQGTMPVSITIKGSLVYVLNSASLSIAGFTLNPAGQLTFIKGSNLALNKLANAPEQIGFSNRFDGSVLVVTEKGSNQIDTYTVNSIGVPTGPITASSTGNGPYGFAFNKKGQLIDSDAGSSAVSSYNVSRSGVLGVISGPVSTGVSSDTPCWVALTDNGRFAYTGNADTAISSFGIAENGALTLINEKAGTLASGGSLDLGFSPGSRFLYVINAAGSISGFSVDETNGSLTLVATRPGVSLSAAGIAVS